MNSADILAVLWFFLGAGIANMAPVLVSKLPVVKDWKAPLDFGLKLRGKPLFGKNKTWRGLLSGIIFATATVAAQQALLRGLDTDIFVGGQSFNSLPLLVIGPLLGAGALIGDALESMFKRQIGIAPGKSWFPFDQTDYIIGAVLFTYPVVPLSLWLYAALLAIGFGLHVVTAYLGYLLKLKDSPI